ncbi:unnamed protein product [Rhizoctonia solani]|uniref:Uncharacterized protein n=1 Tax=Rhizoctonia solani TaxID=456999 RepID=A0A8H3A782_9AGAM|nr:unnamed protein product [Rhizoctonia solani]
MPVTLSSGFYKIFTETPNGKLYAGVPRDSSLDITGGLPVVAGPESSASEIELRNIDGLKYEFRLWHHGGLSLGFKRNQFEQGNEVVALPNHDVSEWMITGGRNPEKYRIFTPQSKLYWTITQETTNTTAIALRELGHDESEIVDWEIEFQRNSE